MCFIVGACLTVRVSVLLPYVVDYQVVILQLLVVMEPQRDKLDALMIWDIPLAAAGCHLQSR